ncbi:UNVERIFIED_ORG: cytochrome c peroxidase [Arthrobacter sp. UYCu721]
MSVSTLIKNNASTPMFAIFEEPEAPESAVATKDQKREELKSYLNAWANGFGSIGRKGDPDYINFAKTAEEFRDFC